MRANLFRVDWAECETITLTTAAQDGFVGHVYFCITSVTLDLEQITGYIYLPLARLPPNGIIRIVMLEDSSHDSDSLSETIQDQEQNIWALKRIKSIKLEKNLSILQHNTRRQAHGRRYFGGDRLEVLSHNRDSSTTKTPQLSQRGRRKVGRPQTNRMGENEIVSWHTTSS